MATARGDEPGRYGGERYGAERYRGERYGSDRPQVSPPPTGGRRRLERRPSLLSEIADLEPDQLTPARRLYAAMVLMVVVLALSIAAGVLVYALFGLVG